MYLVTVEFDVLEDHREAFMVAMKEQAETSLRLEAGCHYFDVCVLEGDKDGIVFLYELYEDRAAFDAHLASDHFVTFNALVTPWTRAKTVCLGTKIDTTTKGASS